MSNTPMTCAEFDDAMMDELYGELDAATSDRLAEHASACASCAAKFSKLKSTRSALGALVVTPPEEMESRILAAAAAAEAAMRAGPAPMPSNVIALPTAHHARDLGPSLAPGPQPPKQEGGAKVFAFLSKPQLAAAAVVVLVLGAAAFTTMSVSMKRSPMASSEADQAPAAVAASAAPSPAPAAPGAADEPSPMATATTIAAAQEAPAPAASAAAGPAFAATPPPPPAATMAGGALALNDRAEEAKTMKKAAPGAARPRPPSAAPPAVAPAAKAPDGKAANDFDSAKRLADSGRCAEALPALEALAPTDSRADLLAARCVRSTQGCGPATTRYDAVATRNLGNATGATAQREKQQCQISLDHEGTKSGAAAPAQHAKPAKPATDPAPAATTTTVK